MSFKRAAITRKKQVTFIRNYVPLGRPRQEDWKFKCRPGWAT
jgi:hypothetical protein